MQVAQVTLKPSSFLLVKAVNIYDQLKKKQNLHGELFQPRETCRFLLKWLDFACKISQSNSKCKHILTLRIPTIYIPARELQKEAFLNYQKLLLPGLNAQLTLQLITVPSKIQNTLLLSSIKESLHWGWAGWIRAGRWSLKTIFTGSDPRSGHVGESIVFAGKWFVWAIGRLSRCQPAVVCLQWAPGRRVLGGVLRIRPSLTARLVLLFRDAHGTQTSMS